MELSWSAFHTPYTEDEVKKYVPKSGGVYLLWVKYTSGKWKCFYVGKSEDLEKRLLEHLASSEPNMCIKENVSKYTCGFFWAVVSSASDRAGIEKALFDYYQTECNEQDPGGTPIHVNVPQARE